MASVEQKVSVEQKKIRPLAVVTGASSGIGYELARQFVQNGFDVLIAAEDDGITEAARSLVGGGRVESVKVDLARYEGVEALYAKIQSLGRPVDAIAINAGVGVGGDFARQTRLEDELNLISLNVTSSVHLAKRVSKDMAQRRSGRILFTSSIAALMPAPFEAVYGASKAFIQSFSESLRNELADVGVTVTALLPGPTETNFFHRAGMDDTRVGQQEKDDAGEVARQGFEALMAGKDKVVAGSLKNRAMAAAVQVIPDTASAQLHRKLSEPGSGTKNK
ncbi:SDR family NAD(P)-dependent oxidoreductase [Stigmatella aurantiaca]|uniref:Dehydrogenase DhgA n=1 Tax=Stigmatella aurantiaca (strain DW4/3-1) TaxID=378806 RepID=Q092A0_STIAD|nr:SDR family NAD(P)-dependent oxidoreductase [Stigmatella aurantiaca]EAU66577.1 dehydrogenase DhgA [Stigmatella aurantiaca DW4/3-1]